jgi:hypothetical protein
MPSPPIFVATTSCRPPPTTPSSSRCPGEPPPFPPCLTHSLTCPQGFPIGTVAPRSLSHRQTSCHHRRVACGDHRQCMRAAPTPRLGLLYFGLGLGQALQAHPGFLAAAHCGTPVHGRASFGLDAGQRHFNSLCNFIFCFKFPKIQSNFQNLPKSVRNSEKYKLNFLIIILSRYMH